jgi:Domain of unknown function (DUF6950)
MARLPDWERRFAEVVEKHRELPFKWGKSDCFILATDAVDALIGYIPSLMQVGAYSTEAGAYRLILAKGYSDLGSGFADIFEEVEPAYANRGDLVTVLADEDKEGAAVCIGASLLGKGREGLTFVSRSRIKRAFKVV